MADKNFRRKNDCHYGCAIEAAFDVLGGRWKGVILYHLLDAVFVKEVVASSFKLLAIN